MKSASAFGAVTILNATATGHGCALAVVGGVSATWQWQEEGLIVTGAPDSRLAQACLDIAKDELQLVGGASIETSSPVPASRGLKTSSSAAAAMLRAAGVPEEKLEACSVKASRRAGVTITGAFDDQVAVVRGGCHLTDNARQQVVAQFMPEPWHVAIWVPERTISKSSVAQIEANAIAAQIEEAENRLLADDIPGAMTLNGHAFTQLYMAAGLPISPEPASVALDAGAVGAGLSGTGPAVAALFEEKTELPEVPGGSWMWTQVQGAP